MRLGCGCGGHRRGDRVRVRVGEESEKEGDESGWLSWMR